MPNIEIWGAPRGPATSFRKETLFVKIDFSPKKSLISLSLFWYGVWMSTYFTLVISVFAWLCNVLVLSIVNNVIGTYVTYKPL